MTGETSDGKQGSIPVTKVNGGYPCDLAVLSRNAIAAAGT